MDYFILDHNNKPCGPFTLYQLRGMGLTRKSYVWARGWDKWVHAGDVEEINKYVLHAPKATPTPESSATESSAAERSAAGRSAALSGQETESSAAGRSAAGRSAALSGQETKSSATPDAQETGRSAAGRSAAPSGQETKSSATPSGQETKSSAAPSGQETKSSATPDAQETESSAAPDAQETKSSAAPDAQETESSAAPNGQKAKKPASPNSQKRLFACMAILFVLVCLLTSTNPNIFAHRREARPVVEEAVEADISSGHSNTTDYPNGTSVDRIFDATLVYHNYYLFSTTTVQLRQTTHFLSFGILGHVFTTSVGSL